LATGARQFVVQDALEMTLCFEASYALSLTPRQIVMSSPLAGAEMITFFAGPPRCLRASSAFVNKPVDSTTTDTSMDVQSIFAGSFSLKTLMLLPSTLTLASPE